MAGGSTHVPFAAWDYCHSLMCCALCVAEPARASCQTDAQRWAKPIGWRRGSLVDQATVEPELSRTVLGRRRQDEVSKRKAVGGKVIAEHALTLHALTVI